MSHQLTAEDARRSLTAHVAARGAEIHAQYGPHFGWPQLQRLLADRACVRYPCEIVFDATPLQPGELAHPVPKGARPEDGFVLHVQPQFAAQPAALPLIALYQLVAVNYGPFASAEDAETFGAAVLGMDRDCYYQAICRLADEIVGSTVEMPPQV